MAKNIYFSFSCGSLIIVKDGYYDEVGAECQGSCLAGLLCHSVKTKQFEKINWL